MSAAGIIAEYNPFHRGHQYQIGQIRRTLGAQYVIVVMSGDFVQRGAPALLSKYERTRMALLGGADLVLELPAAYSTASAERFALGGIRLLDSLRVVDHLSFGCETELPEQIPVLARLLAAEEPDFKAALRRHLGEGGPFPAARMQAVLDAYPQMDRTALTGLLTQPNNILGIEYCKALIRTGSRIRPAPMRRMGQGYHDAVLSADSFSSAGAIREMIRAALASGTDTASVLSDPRLVRAVPEEVFPVLAGNVSAGSVIFEEDLDLVLHYRLLSIKDEELEGLLDVPADLARRIRHMLPGYRGFGQFCELLKTRNRTLAGVRRALIHILLDIRTTDAPRYCRVLGFRRCSTALLRRIRDHSECELIVKPSASAALRADRAGLLSSELYRGLLLHKSSAPDKALLSNELQQSPVII